MPELQSIIAKHKRAIASTSACISEAAHDGAIDESENEKLLSVFAIVVCAQ